MEVDLVIAYVNNQDESWRTSFFDFCCKNNIRKMIPSMLPSGAPCWSRIVIKESYKRECVFLNHYMTKSLSEFIKQKLNRADAVFGSNLGLNYFWRINKRTKDKEDYLKSKGLL